MVLYDDDRLQEEAVDMGFSSEDMKSFEQKAPGILTRLLRLRPAEYLELKGSVECLVQSYRIGQESHASLIPSIL